MAPHAPSPRASTHPQRATPPCVPWGGGAALATPVEAAARGAKNGTPRHVRFRHHLACEHLRRRVAVEAAVAADDAVDGRGAVQAATCDDGRLDVARAEVERLAWAGAQVGAGEGNHARLPYLGPKLAGRAGPRESGCGRGGKGGGGVEADAKRAGAAHEPRPARPTPAQLTTAPALHVTHAPPPAFDPGPRRGTHNVAIDDCVPSQLLVVVMHHAGAHDVLARLGLVKVAEVGYREHADRRHLGRGAGAAGGAHQCRASGGWR
eukprot:scaffold14794_cov96-Isochrysis_galbana.AAC.2